MQPEHPKVSIKIFEGFQQFMATKGCALAHLLDATGIPPATFENPNGTLPLNQVSALFERAALEARDPCLGLHWAEAYAPGGSGVLGYVVLNAGTLREAMQAVARYLSLVLDPVRLSFKEADGTGVLSWYLPALTETSTTQYIAFSTAVILLRLRAVTGPSWQPVQVELSHRELPCSATIERIFGPNVSFNASTNAIHADAESLDIKACNRDPRIFEMMELLGSRLLAERAVREDFVSQTQRAIVDQLSKGEVTLEGAAETLGLSPRTLQSKLTSSETSFDALLQETRKNLAIGYLRESDLSMTDIALMLGFSELSAFSRATQRWFGMPPSTYRQQLRGQGSKG